MAPAAADDWLRVDEAYGTQMQRRLELFSQARDAVLWMEPTALNAAREVLAEALAVLPSLGFTVGGSDVTCPDGRVVPLDLGEPLLTGQSMFWWALFCAFLPVGVWRKRRASH